MGCGCSGNKPDDSNKKKEDKAKNEVSQEKVYDDFKLFSIDKVNNPKTLGVSDPAKPCSNDDNVSYSTLDDLSQVASVPAPTNLTATISGLYNMSLSWAVPDKYLSDPEDFFGFFVLRNLGTTAPSSYNDITTPNAQVIYVGRNNRLGDPSGFDFTSELYNADLGLKNKLVYSYSVFTIYNNNTYSLADSVTTDPITSVGGALWSENFSGCTIGVDTISCTESTWNIIENTMGSVSDVSIGINKDPLLSDPYFGNFVSLQGAPNTPFDKNAKSVELVSEPISLLLGTETEVEPNTLYSVKFYSRSSYNDTALGGITDNGANAFSGVVTLTANNCTLSQNCSALQDEDLPNTDPYTPCSVDDCAKRVPAYFGTSSITWNYLGSALNGVWVLHGMSFIVGDTCSSTPLNRYGSSGGNPTEKETPATGTPTITITLTLPPIDPSSVPIPAGIDTIFADFTGFNLRKGANSSQNYLANAESLTPANLSLNPNFYFDPTTTATEDGNLHGLPGTTVVPAAADWTMDVGYFVYDAPYPVLPTATIDNSLFSAIISSDCITASLQQDLHYMNLIKEEVYMLSFDFKITPNDLQVDLCNGTGGHLCTDVDPGAELIVNLDIRDVSKTSAAFFQDAPTGGTLCKDQTGVPLPTKFTGIDYYCNPVDGPAHIDQTACPSPAGCIEQDGWKNMKFYFRVCRNVSPTVNIDIYQKLAQNYQAAIKNVLVTTAVPGESLARNGLEVAFPIPTTPSYIGGKPFASYQKLWDFNTPAKVNPPGEPKQTVLEWLSRLGGATPNASGRYVGGLFILNQKDSDYKNITVVTDTTLPAGKQQVLQTKALGNNPGLDSKGKPINNAQSGVLMTSEYYTDGVFDVRMKLESVTLAGEHLEAAEGNAVADPINLSFASWVFHYIDYSGTYDTRLYMHGNPTRNAEIDIEMGGNCPKSNQYTTTADGQPYNYATGRLNSWGGNQAGTGSNLEMHTVMPENPTSKKPITLLDGEYHNLTFVLNSGFDIPDGDIKYRTNIRETGYIKWYVDGVPWGCGWIGANYGFDNIPNTAMRFVVGPWFPVDWAGCICPSQFPCITPTDPVDPANCSKCEWVNCLPPNITWDEAVFYYQNMSYTPLYSNNQVDDQTNYLVPPFTAGTGTQPAQVENPPNRAKWLPASNPYVHFDPLCDADDAPKMP